MAADQADRRVPPSLSAKVTGYVDNRCNLSVTVFCALENGSVVSKQLNEAVFV